jgi:hypothetical protein
MKPHNQHQLQEAIISFLKEHPGRHSVDDVHFGISDYFADPCYPHGITPILWKLSEDGTIKYRHGFFFPHQPTTQPQLPTKTNQMTEQHRIIPSLDLLNQWKRDWVYCTHDPANLDEGTYIATQAARWGADQELEACCEWLQDPDLNVDTDKLRRARRPKPPSEKEQALRLLETCGKSGVKLTSDQCDIIRRALEATPGAPQ